MKKLISIIMIVCVFTSVFTVSSTVVEAKSKKYNLAVKKYKKYLKNKNGTYEIVDIDKNGIPELLFHNDSTADHYVFTYDRKDKKMIKIRQQVSGKAYYMPVMYNAKKHQVNFRSGATQAYTGDIIYKISGKKAKKVIKFESYCEKNWKKNTSHMVYLINGKKKNYKTYNKKYKKYLKGFKECKKETDSVPKYKSNSDYKLLDNLFNENYYKADEDVKVKYGKYYFWQKDSGIYISKKNKNFKKTPFWNALINNKQAFYIRDDALYKYKLSTKKETKIKNIPFKTYPYEEPYTRDDWHVSALYKNKIYMTADFFGNYNTYSYDIKTHKIKKVKSNFQITHRYKNYFLGTGNLDTYSFDPFSIFIYKIKNNKFVKVKKLTSRGIEHRIIGNKIYYVKYDAEYPCKKAALYKCNINGKKKTKIFEAKSNSNASGDNRYVSIEHVTSKNCIVQKNGKIYKYTYKTKKYKKIG